MAAGTIIKVKRKTSAFTTTQLVAGEVGLDTTDGVLYSSTDGTDIIKWVRSENSRSFTMEDPTNAEDRTLWRTEAAITITKVFAVLRGSATPSVSIQLRHHTTDRNAAGNAVFSASQDITSTTAGHSLTTFTDATIPAGSMIWFETTAQSGTVDEIGVTIYFDVD